MIYSALYIINRLRVPDPDPTYNIYAYSEIILELLFINNKEEYGRYQLPVPVSAIFYFIFFNIFKGTGIVQCPVVQIRQT